MEAILVVLVLVFGAGWFVTAVRLRAKVRGEQLQSEALSLLPSPGIDISGQWMQWIVLEEQNILAGVSLSQYGSIVRGAISPKFGSPMELCGMLDGNRLLAYYWLPDRDCLGSGLLDLKFDGRGKRSNGTIRWFTNETGENGESYDIQWERPEEFGSN